MIELIPVSIDLQTWWYPGAGLELRHGRVYHESFHSVYVVKGVRSLLKNLILNKRIILFLVWSTIWSNFGKEVFRVSFAYFLLLPDWFISLSVYFVQSLVTLWHTAAAEAIRTVSKSRCYTAGTHALWLRRAGRSGQRYSWSQHD